MPAIDAQVVLSGFTGMTLNPAGGLQGRALLIADAFCANGAIHRRDDAWQPSTAWRWSTEPGATDTLGLGVFGFRDGAAQDYTLSTCHVTAAPTQHRFRLYRGRQQAGLGGSLASYGESTTPYTFAQVHDHVYLTNGDSIIRLIRFSNFDRSATGVGFDFEQVAAIDREKQHYRTADDDPGPYMATIPNGRYILYHANRLFMAGFSHDPSLVRWSNLGDPRGWPYANYLHVSRGNGHPVTGLAPLGSDLNDGLLIFTDTDVFLARGNFVSAEETDLKRIVAGVGCPGQGLVTQGAGVTYFLGSDGSPRSLSPSGLRELAVDTNVAALFKARVTGRVLAGGVDYSPYAADGPTLHDACSVYYPARGWWCVSYPTRGGIYRAMWVYDSHTDGWWIYTGDSPGHQMCVVPGTGTDSLWLVQHRNGNMEFYDAQYNSSEAFTSRIVLGPLWREETGRRQVKHLRLFGVDTINNNAAATWLTDGERRGVAPRYELTRPTSRYWAVSNTVAAATRPFRLGVDLLRPRASVKLDRVSFGNHPMGRDVAVELQPTVPFELHAVSVNDFVVSDD